MAKKFLLGMMAFASLFATSCTNELDPVEMGNTSTVSFKVGTPAIESRAYSDGATATVLQYAVYDANGNYLEKLTKTDATINGSTTVNLQLTTGNTYSVIFWAAAPNAPYTVYFADKTMEVNYNGAVSNDESRDAFYKYHTFTVTGAQTETIELKRPFAQLNIGTNDFDESKSAGYTPTQSSVKVSNVYTTLNFVDGTVSNPTANAVTFAPGVIPTTFDATTNAFTGEEFPVAGYEYLAMNYLLVGADKETVDIEFTYTDGTDAKTRTVGSVPVQRNYRTNIYGQLLTSDVDINVEINPDYEKPDYEVVVWDGKTIKEPVYDATTLTYEISHPSELAYIAQLVNGTLDTDNLNRAAVAADDLKGETVKLMCDIDLFNHEWTPIGNSSNIFKGTFDGQGHTIFNLVVRGGNNSNQGLFGVTHEGEIKNLVVENANVSGRLAVGVVAGTPYTSKYTDITVKGHVEVNGFAYVGGVGGRNAYADWTNITVDADETSYVKANSVENGTAYRTYVGGVVGFNGEGGHSFKNITSDINVKGSTIDVGGLFGIAHYGNKFENLTCTGDVEIYAAEESAEAEEIGGIAGVWMDSNVAPVTFTNIKFEGTVTTNIARETVWYDNLIGKPYNNKGTGKLIIDGYEMLANGVGLKDGEYYVFNADGLRWISDASDLNETFENKTINLVNDITLSGEWKPIGYTSHFKGTFNGNNKTISGMTITEHNGKNAKALFGIISGKPTIKNLVIDGANVAMKADHDGDFYAAGLVGTFYGTFTIENVTVKNSTFVGNNKVAGLLAHDDVCSNFTIDNCHVLNCNISSTNLTDGGNVGGFIGLFQGAANGKFEIKNSSVEGCTITGINSSNTGKRANGEFIACISSKAGQKIEINGCKVENNNFTETINGTDPVTYINVYGNKFVGGERNGHIDIPGEVWVDGTLYPPHIVAKVGNTEYYSIDEAVANWTNNTTLTLLDDVTLSDVITLKSTEYHILDLGTYTLTAASKKDAIEITAEGRSSASYALDIKADATNPGGITATGKAVVKTKGKSGVKDRPIIRFYNGVYNATNIISHSGSNGTNCPQFQFHNGVYNGTISANRALIQFYGGTFNGSLMMSVDSSAYALISGGRFKYLSNLYGSTLNKEKFTIGSAKGKFDKGIYVDDDGYYVVGGDVITGFGDKFAAKVTIASNSNAYLTYSSAATYGLYYTNADLAQGNVEYKQ